MSSGWELSVLDILSGGIAMQDLSVPKIELNAAGVLSICRDGTLIDIFGWTWQTSSDGGET